MCQRGEITEEKLTYYKQNACPSCGACSFMGTASTMQIMAEALGLMLPGSALMPATCPELKEMAYKAGRQVMELVKAGLKVSDIVTMEAFENAKMCIRDRTTAVLPIFSIFSIIIASSLLQKLKNELLTAALLFACAALSCFILLPVYNTAPTLSVTMMTLITGSMYGINLMLISRVPRHFARFGRVATISGILNASTYIGSSLSTAASGAISDHYGWHATISVWAVTCLLYTSRCV